MDARKLLDQLGGRMETLLDKEAEPDELMQEILAASEEAGLIDAPGAIRTSSPPLFVMDLLTDNPQAYEWAQMVRDQLKPMQISSRSDLLDAISAP